MPLAFGLNGVLIAQSVADIFALILAVPITIKVLKELNLAEKKLPDNV